MYLVTTVVATKTTTTTDAAAALRVPPKAKTKKARFKARTRLAPNLWFSNQARQQQQQHNLSVTTLSYATPPLSVCALTFFLANCSMHRSDIGSGHLFSRTSINSARTKGASGDPPPSKLLPVLSRLDVILLGFMPTGLPWQEEREDPLRENHGLPLCRLGKLEELVATCQRDEMARFGSSSRRAESYAVQSGVYITLRGSWSNGACRHGVGAVEMVEIKGNRMKWYHSAVEGITCALLNCDCSSTALSRRFDGHTSRYSGMNGRGTHSYSRGAHHFHRFKAIWIWKPRVSERCACVTTRGRPPWITLFMSKRHLKPFYCCTTSALPAFII